MRFALSLAALLAAPSAFALAPAAQAQDFANLSEAERADFNAAVRAYLLAEPEVLMEALDVLQSREQQNADARSKELLSGNKDVIANNPNDWAGGNLQGDITLVEFMDYRCGYCHKAYQDVEDLVKTDGNIRFVLKEFPVLGEQSVMAAQFTIALKQLHGDDAYKAAHDALFTMRGEISQESLTRILTTQKIDPAPVFEKMKSEDVQKVINENYELAQMFNINGTPSFILNDSLIQGYLPLEEMRKMVEASRQDG